jgi:hypothetical protein
MDTGLLQREVAELLGVSRPRVAQLVKAGHLRRNAAGRIDPAEVERCRRKEPIAWANPPALPPPAPAPAPAEVERFRAGLPILATLPFSVLRPAQLPPAPAAATAHRDDSALHRELQRLQDLEARWQSSYTTFWHWVRECHYERELWRELGNQPEIGAVMATARRLLVAELAELNELLFSR